VKLAPQPVFDARVLTKAKRTYFASKQEWVFRLALSSNVNSDRDNLIGLSRTASNGYDLSDRPEPPRMGDEPYLFFPHPEWKRPVRDFASDIRRSYGEQNIFVAGISACGGEVSTLKLSLEGLTEGCGLHAFIHTTEGLMRYIPGSSVEIAPAATVQYVTIFLTEDADFLSAFPQSFTMEHPAPNPLRHSTSIGYTLPYRFANNGWLDPAPSEISIRLFDAAGRQVRELAHKRQKPGSYRLVWDGKTQTGRPAASGEYFCVLKIGDLQTVRKLIVMR
jgi:hypothetical protein